MARYEWLEKKRKLTVDNLRPWSENPRLNPEETHVTISDYAEDFISENKDDFFDLMKSIAEFGYVPADPIIVWKKEENDKYYVAEGNRRLIALKLLRDPNKAPKGVRGTVRRIANGLNIADIEKIPVSIAPTFEDAEWYINQRNSTSSLQRRWSRIQQQRWIYTLYEKYEGDLDKLISVTRMSNAELTDFIRVLKIWDFVKLEEVKSKLTAGDYEKAISYKFPITILERFFASVAVRELWGIEFDGAEVHIRSNKESFYNAFAELIRMIVNPNEDELKIDTRTITSDLDTILENLPEVNLTPDEETASVAEDAEVTGEDGGIAGDGVGDAGSPQPAPVIHLRNNPNRGRLVLPIYTLHTDSARLDGLFDEFKRVPVHLYPNVVAASLRVFLDLAVLNYIRREEGLEAEMCRHYSRGLRDIQLKARLEYIKAHKLTGNVQRVAVRLIDESQQFSLDVLNGFIHSQDTHYMSKENLNRFWDFLFPLFDFLLDIREDNV